MLWSWAGVSAMAGPMDDDLSFLLIKMAVSSWIEQAVIDRVGAGVGRWCGRAIVEACPCSSMTWPQACDKTEKTRTRVRSQS